MTTPAKTVKEVLIAARWILNKLEWVQGAFYRYRHINHYLLPDNNEPNRQWKDLEGCCTLGALNLVETAHLDLRDHAIYLIRKEVGGNPGFWNDYECHSKKDVLQVLNRLIKRLP
jgi:hypothetical protein